MSTLPDLSRYADFLDWLDAQGETDPDLRCIWIGGSAATGGYDDHSDLDVEALAAEGTSTEVYRRLLGGIVATFAPTSVWELPESTYSDGRQCFVTFDPSPGDLATPTRLVDIVVWEPTDEHRHIDVRRHGTPLVRVDPEGLLVPRHDDETDLRRTMEATTSQIRQRRLVVEWLVNRAIERSHLPEAVSLYLRFALTPVVQLLRARDCPERHDYALRYLHTDLRPADAARIDQLLPGVERLRELSAECFAWQDELLHTDSSAV
jgi:predicted nucleotidyltransferase